SYDCHLGHYDKQSVRQPDPSPHAIARDRWSRPRSGPHRKRGDGTRVAHDTQADSDLPDITPGRVPRLLRPDPRPPPSRGDVAVRPGKHHHRPGAVYVHSLIGTRCSAGLKACTTIAFVVRTFRSASSTEPRA